MSAVSRLLTHRGCCLLLWGICAFLAASVPTVSAAVVFGDEYDSVAAAVYRWHEAWQERDFGRYIAFYDASFSGGGADYGRWKAHKRSVFHNSEPFSVEIRSLHLSRGDDHTVRAAFLQRYYSPSFCDEGEKLMVWKQHGQEWKIVLEEWTAVQMPEASGGCLRNDRSDAAELLRVGVGTEEERADVGGILVELSKFDSPVITFVPGDVPCLHLEFPGIYRWKGVPVIAAGNAFVRRVFVYRYGVRQRLRCAVEMIPGAVCTVTPVFYEKRKSVYLRIVGAGGAEEGEKNGTPTRR